MEGCDSLEHIPKRALVQSHQYHHQHVAGSLKLSLGIGPHTATRIPSDNYYGPFI